MPVFFCIIRFLRFPIIRLDLYRFIVSSQKLILMSHSDSEHIENHPDYKGLKVNSGIDQPPVTNPNAIHKTIRNKRKQLSLNDYVSGILEGNRMILSRAVTLVESVKPEHQEMAQQIILECLPYAGKSTRIGITGVPGAGKSTFIEALGKHITAGGGKLAVLAIDPSSERTKGSILGDKTRMEELASDEHAYIRPSPSAGSKIFPGVRSCNFSLK